MFKLIGSYFKGIYMLTTKQALTVGYKATNKNTLFFVKLLLLNVLGYFATAFCVVLIASIFMQGLQAGALDFKTFVKILVLMPAPFKTLFIIGLLLCLLLIFACKDFFILGWYKVSLDFAKTGSCASIFPSMSLLIKYFIATLCYNSVVLLPFFLTLFISFITGSTFISGIFLVAAAGTYWYLSLRLSFYPYLLLENKAQAWNSLRQSFMQTKGAFTPLLKLSVVIVLMMFAITLITGGLTQPFMPEVIKAIVTILYMLATLIIIMISMTAVASLYDSSSL
jgi:hypothetical protein